MKISASAGALHRASALAGAVVDGTARKFPALGVAHLEAGDAVKITTNNTNIMVTITVPATVTAAGTLAVSCTQLEKLVGALPADAEIVIEDRSQAALFSNGRRHFKLPTTPIAELAAKLRLDSDTGSAVLDRSATAALFARTSFAIGNDARTYLRGTLLHSTNAGLSAVATDGRWLAYCAVPGGGALSADHGLIVPSAALKIINRQLADKAVDRVVLRRSSTLFAVEAASTLVICRLVDGVFPDYQKIIPTPPANTVTVDRADLKAALTRIAAVADQRSVALAWPESGELRLVAGEAADDTIVIAAASGCGRTLLQNHLLAGLLDELIGARVTIGVSGPHEPVLITDDDAGFLAVLAAVTGAAP